ncbi:desmocollin-2 [Salmo salar]|uniref:Desmocollin-2 n=1 Tax=Salmo salar TaxID=8030 RepID=A0A1S3LXP8_SALSA|nr:desmocollin-2 [Salmo salar]|eukprot:XP_013995698.1 PREDICTED: desmocollin-2-like [Salmo salar]
MFRMVVTKMARNLHVNLCFFLIISCVDSCFIPGSIQATVPQTVPVGHVISKVDVDNCDTKTLHFTSCDPDFTVQADGTIVTVHITMVPTNGRTFSVQYQDPNGQEKNMDVHLVQNSRKVLKDGLLKRSKRRWSPMPFNIIENDHPPFPKEVDLVASDSSVAYNVYYTLSGPGVTEDPEGVFSVVKETGMLKVHKAVDREITPQFIFQARVFDRNTNQETDLPLPITVNVEDVNDNAPTFTGQLQFTVLEQSNKGTIVGKVNATDKDEPGTDHTKIRYSLLSETNLFFINPETGVISTKTDTLDREVTDKYFVRMDIRDMNGALNGLSNTATATIVLGDINDNPPTFTKTSYNVSVMENQEKGLILRIPIEDKDLLNTPNWNSEFSITKGNENGNFRIERDPKTNEGLIYLTKPLDYEKTKNLKLEVLARNQAELSGTNAKWVSVPVDVTVGNVDEGPEFTAPTVRFTVQENTPNDTLIGTYTAVDPETKSSAGIKYYKVSDPASWVNVDESTGQLKIANTIDRESHFVVDGVYNITMKAVDASQKTGTGTVIIQVEDMNDHVPDILSKDLVLCGKDGGEMGSVLVVAEDKDQAPFSAPFSFKLGEKHDDKWAVKPLNSTAVMLEQTKELPSGLYTVPLMVGDLQGFGSTQTVTVRICRCRNGVCLAQQNSTSLGVWGILAMLLGLALLLLLCMLCALVCVTKNEKMELEDMGDSGGILLTSNIEALGDAVDSNLIIVPKSGIDRSVKGSMTDMGWAGAKNLDKMGGGLGTQQQSGSSIIVTDMPNGFSDQYNGSQYGGQNGGGQYGVDQYGGGQYTSGNRTFDNTRSTGKNMKFNWQTNGLFLQQKLAYLRTEEQGRYADDIIHAYGFEGVGSPAGSVGCCSDQVNQEDLDFLNTLGPKFKVLAEVCTNK